MVESNFGLKTHVFLRFGIREPWEMPAPRLFMALRLCRGTTLVVARVGVGWVSDIVKLISKLEHSYKLVRYNRSL